MGEEMEQVIIQKDSKFQFAEGTPAEIVNQMPDNVVKSLAVVSLSNDNLTSFVSDGVMVRLEKGAGKKGSQRVSFTSPSVKPVPNPIEFHPERVRNMEITPKEYTDQRINSLEKSFDQRLDANEKLISEKIEHIHTKFESTLETKLSALKDSISAEQNTQTQNNRSNMIGIVSIATAVIVGVTTILLTGISIAIAIYL